MGSPVIQELINVAAKVIHQVTESYSIKLVIIHPIFLDACFLAGNPWMHACFLGWEVRGLVVAKNCMMSRDFTM